MGNAALEGFCAALLPPAHGGPDPGALAARIERFLDQAPRHVRAGVRAATVGLDAAAVVTAGHRLAGLDADRARALLERTERARTATAHGLHTLKALVLLVAGAEAFRDELAGAIAATGLAREDPPLDVTPAHEWPPTAEADVVVVGSGAGGAMAARTLARAGLRVVVVEEGRRHTVEEFRGHHPLRRFTDLYRDAGTTVALGRPPIMLPMGRGVGGTTLVNSGTCYRTPEAVLTRWRDEAGLALADPSEFSGYLDEVEATLDVAPVPAAVMGRNGELALLGAQRLGWHAGPLRRNAPGCEGCCQCALGCPRNAKAGVHLNALPQACAAGARILSEARVTRVLYERGAVTGVRLRRRDGSALAIAAPRVIVAAGAIHTPRLLARSGLGGHPELGRHLAIHPAIGVAGRFEEPVVAWRGVLQSAAVEELHESDGILIEATSTPPGMGSLSLPGYGGPLLREIAEVDHLATIGALVADEGPGRVSPLGPIRYDVTPRDAGRLRTALVAMGRLLFAAGAREVLTGLPGHAPARDMDGLEAQVAAAPVAAFHLAAFHPTGTAGAGADPRRYPVGEAGALRGVEGAWVADASILPSSPTVNPQISIMALALAVADGVVRRG